jgi:hypothetical protein
MTAIRALTLALLAMLQLAACQPTMPVTTAAPASDNPGLSQQQAIVIGKGHNEMTGIEAEYAWIEKNRPGWTVTDQALAEDKGRYYDILTIRNGSVTQDIWFDITNFYGVLF